MTANEGSLIIRKDIRELEVLEVKAATDYELFKSTLTLDEQMEILRLQMPSEDTEQSGSRKGHRALKIIQFLLRCRNKKRYRSLPYLWCSPGCLPSKMIEKHRMPKRIPGEREQQIRKQFSNF